jgi:hypothetical protein
MASARGTATASAVANRCNFQLLGLLACHRAESPMGSAMGDFTDCAMMA